MSRRAIIQNEDEFDVPSTDATEGAEKRTERFDLSSAAVQITMTTGSVQLQGSIDGSNWVDIGMAASANAVITLNHFWRKLRIRTVTAGDAVAHLGAYEFLW